MNRRGAVYEEEGGEECECVCMYFCASECVHTYVCVCVYGYVYQYW